MLLHVIQPSVKVNLHRDRRAFFQRRLGKVDSCQSAPHNIADFDSLALSIRNDASIMRLSATFTQISGGYEVDHRLRTFRKANSVFEHHFVDLLRWRCLRLGCFLRLIGLQCSGLVGFLAANDSCVQTSKQGVALAGKQSNEASLGQFERNV
jgi:hypothetical protein